MIDRTPPDIECEQEHASIPVRTLAFLIIGAVSLASPMRAQRGVGETIGCYDLTIGSWVGSTYKGKPQHIRVRLDSAVLQPALSPGLPVLRGFVTLSASLGDVAGSLASMPRQSWYASDAALHISWGGAPQGVSITLRASGDSLIGSVTLGGDYITKESRAAVAPVGARRVVCGA